MQPTIINRFGKIVGWNNITLRLYGRDVEAFNEIEYHDKQNMANEYGGGKYPIGQSEGNYETENCSISFYSEELIALQKSIPPGKRIMDAPPAEVIVMYDYNGVIYKDIWRSSRPMNNGRAAKNSDGKIVTKIDFLVSHIDWSVQN
ncbi:MAG: hypothetical protein JNK73_13200 [Bacteroidia bacterium]|nr:hypothetical protein [Bacteroidia bacterium]